MKKFNLKNVLALGLVVAFTLGLAGIVKAATAVSLGTADDFSVLAGSAIVDTTPSNIVSGDVGLSPTGGASIAIPTGEVIGTIYAVDAAGPDGAGGNNPALVNGAKTALSTAFASITGQPTTGVISADLGGQTLFAGVYDDNDAPDSLAITGTLTLDAQGDPDAVFIFKTGSTLTTAAASSVSLINGAQACNVFWQVGSSATLGTTSTFKGTILASVAITDNGGSTIEGRLLASSGAVTLNNTTVTKATCVVPPVVPPASPQGSSGGIPVPPLISVEKIPTPLALPAGPGSVTYNYTVSNIGVITMKDIQVTDNACANVNFISGDTDGDSLLGTEESWKYSCTTNLSETTTNTVTASGRANGYTVVDTANATVVVSLPVVPPLIHIVKKPNLFVLPPFGGAVTYSYTVTNPGTEPLSDVSVIDDKCTGLPGRVLGHPGDLNQNNLLESNEAWSFTCQTNITQTTTNTATAEGHANGLTVIDFALATVAVAVPGLPNTGFPPANVVILIGLLLIVSTVLVIVLKKKSAIN